MTAQIHSGAHSGTPSGQAPHIHHHKPFPKAMLWAAAALISFSILVALAGRMTGFGTVSNPTATPRAAYDLTFADTAAGAVAIADAVSGAPVIALEPGTNGFARGVLRGLARDRKLEAIGRAAPFRLTSWSDGRLTLRDVATGREVEVNAFGPTQIATFARILEAAAAKLPPLTPAQLAAQAPAAATGEGAR